MIGLVVIAALLVPSLAQANMEALRALAAFSEGGSARQVVAALRWGHLGEAEVEMLGRLQVELMESEWTLEEWAFLGEHPSLLSMASKPEIRQALEHPTPNQQGGVRLTQGCSESGGVGRVCLTLAEAEEVARQPLVGAPPTAPDTLARMDALAQAIEMDNMLDATSGAVFATWNELAQDLVDLQHLAGLSAEFEAAAERLIRASNSSTPAGSPGYNWFRVRADESALLTVLRHAQHGILRPGELALEQDAARSRRRFKAVRYTVMGALAVGAAGPAVWNWYTGDRGTDEGP